MRSLNIKILNYLLIIIMVFTIIFLILLNIKKDQFFIIGLEQNDLGHYSIYHENSDYNGEQIIRVNGKLYKVNLEFNKLGIYHYHYFGPNVNINFEHDSVVEIREENNNMLSYIISNIL